MILLLNGGFDRPPSRSPRRLLATRAHSLYSAEYKSQVASKFPGIEEI